MRSGYLSVVMAVVAVFAVAGLASAGFVDNFGGASLDTNLWIATAGSPVVADGVLTLNNAAGLEAISSLDNAGPGDTMYYRMAAPAGSGGTFGADHLQLRTDRRGYFSFCVYEGSPLKVYDGPDVAAPWVKDDLFAITWNMDGSATLRKNGAVIDTSTGISLVATPETFGAAIFGGPDNLVFEGIGLNMIPDASVPEPSAIVLGVTGLLGLLAYAWRKRR